MSEIWAAFPTELIKKSFEHCGITSQLSLHSQLGQITRANDLVNLYVDLFNEIDEFRGLDNDEEDHSTVFDPGCELEEEEEPISDDDSNSSSIIEPEDLMDVDPPTNTESIPNQVRNSDICPKI